MDHDSTSIAEDRYNIYVSITASLESARHYAYQLMRLVEPNVYSKSRISLVTLVDVKPSAVEPR